MTEKTPAHVYSFVTDTGNGQQLSINGTWGPEVPVNQMHRDVDKLKAVGDRLRAMHELPLLMDRINGMKGQLEVQELDFAEHMRKHEKARDIKMTARLELGLANLRVEISKGEIAYLEAAKKIEIED